MTKFNKMYFKKSLLITCYEETQHKTENYIIAFNFLMTLQKMSSGATPKKLNDIYKLIIHDICYKKHETQTIIFKN